MQPISRRGALAGLSGAGLAAALSAHAGAARAAPAGAGVEVFVIGPFPLGDWYKRKTAKRGPGGPLAIGADPGRDNLIAGLNECQLFLLDARDLSDPKAPKFADGKNGFPLLVAGGKVAYEWESEDKKKKFQSRVVSVRAVTNHTNYTKAGASRAVVLEVRLEFRGEAGLLSGMCVYSMTGDSDLVYDLSGKQLPPE